jgi:hypothetical protein
MGVDDEAVREKSFFFSEVMDPFVHACSIAHES